MNACVYISLHLLIYTCMYKFIHVGRYDLLYLAPLERYTIPAGFYQQVAFLQEKDSVLCSSFYSMLSSPQLGLGPFWSATYDFLSFASVSFVTASSVAIFAEVICGDALGCSYFSASVPCFLSKFHGHSYRRHFSQDCSR